MDGEILFRILHHQRRIRASAHRRGDQTFHAGLYIRVIMLVSAVLVGLLIVHSHSDQEYAKTESQSRKYSSNSRNTRVGTALAVRRAKLDTPP